MDANVYTKVQVEVELQLEIHRKDSYTGADNQFWK